MQFFNIKYGSVTLASLLRKIKIFKTIKPLGSGAIYAAVFGKMSSQVTCEI
jgi:hypothetical protein